jgi:guanylate kinase
MKGKLVLIIGPSGVGKSAILRRLQAGNATFHFPRSATTRARRQGESSDLYHFVTEPEMDTLINEGKVLEWAKVHGGARYATLIDEIIPFIERGTTVIREVDVQGFESIRRHPLFSGDSPMYRLQSIFILPESTEQLLAHIAKRAPMARDELDRRMKSIEKELAFASLCTAQVRNREGKLEETIKEVEKLVLQK